MAAHLSRVLSPRPRSVVKDGQEPTRRPFLQSPYEPPQTFPFSGSSSPSKSQPSASQQHRHQQTQTSSAKWQPMADPTANTQSENAVAVADTGRLSFYQRHFTIPITIEPKEHLPKDRRMFSFRSRGFIIAACTMLLILLASIGVAVGVCFSRPPHHSSPGKSSLVHLALDDNFPDPTLYHEGDTWYAYATNNAAGILHRPENASSYEFGTSNIQIATSLDFLNWTLLNSSADPLPDVGSWAVQGHDNHTKPPIPRANVWAPSVIKHPSDESKYIMYYTAARNAISELDLESNNTSPKALQDYALLPNHPAPHCIGAATASSPLGPFDPLPTPIACQIDSGGAIDPAAFIDIGKNHNGETKTPYLLYKLDGNNIGHGGSCGNTVAPKVPTPLLLQKLHPSALSPVGRPMTLLNRTSSDGPLIEAPFLVRSAQGIYFLFFSSGCTRAPSYDLKYATSTRIEGPYRRAKGALLRTGMWGLNAPGSVGLSDDGQGRWNAVFHARVEAEGQGRVRGMFVGKVELRGRRARFVER